MWNCAEFREKSCLRKAENLFAQAHFSGSELPNSRFCLSEEKAKRFDAEVRGNAARVVSAELFLRGDGEPVLKRLFVDGEEF